MKFDPSTITKARGRFVKRWAMFAIGGACLFLLAVLVVNLHAGAGHANNAPTKAVAAATIDAVIAKAPTIDQPPITHVIPQIAHQTAASPSAVAAAPATSVPITAPVQPPAGIQRGFVLQKDYRANQWGTPVLNLARVVGVQTVSVQAPSTDGEGARETEWSAWINLTQPTTLAWVRLAGGEGTVSVAIDGNSLGDPVDHWSSNGPIANFASVPLTAGWHQITIHDSRRSWVRGAGVAVQVALGTATNDPVSPQPWAVPPGANAAPANPQIAQRPAPASAPGATHPGRAESTVSSNNSAAKPTASTTTTTKTGSHP